MLIKQDRVYLSKLWTKLESMSKEQLIAIVAADVLQQNAMMEDFPQGVGKLQDIEELDKYIPSKEDLAMYYKLTF